LAAVPTRGAQRLPGRLHGRLPDPIAPNFGIGDDKVGLTAALTGVRAARSGFAGSRASRPAPHVLPRGSVNAEHCTRVPLLPVRPKTRCVLASNPRLRWFRFRTAPACRAEAREAARSARRRSNRALTPTAASSSCTAPPPADVPVTLKGGLNSTLRVPRTRALPTARLISPCGPAGSLTSTNTAVLRWRPRIRSAARISSSVCVGGMPTDDREGGLVRDDFARQVLPVAGLRDDFEAAVGQRSCQAFAEHNGSSASAIRMGSWRLSRRDWRNDWRNSVTRSWVV
jgi:hypothetical protein